MSTDITKRKTEHIEDKKHLAIFMFLEKAFWLILDIILPSKNYLHRNFVGYLKQRKEIQKFINSDSNLCVILGESGMGKSFLALKSIDSFLKKRKAFGAVCLARDLLKIKHKRLSTPDRLERLVTRIINKNAIKTTSWNSVLLQDRLNLPFVIVVDGLNEGGSFGEVVKHYNYFAKCLRETKFKNNIKFIVTCRTKEWNCYFKNRIHYAPNVCKVHVPGLEPKYREACANKFQDYIKVKVDDKISFSGKDLNSNPLAIILEVSLRHAKRMPKSNKLNALLDAHSEWILDDLIPEDNKQDFFGILNDVITEKGLNVRNIRYKYKDVSLEISNVEEIGKIRNEAGKITEFFFFHPSILECVSAKQKARDLLMISDPENRENEINITFEHLYSDKNSHGYHSIGEFGVYLRHGLCR